jgi:AcrR family transcriptional regulator
VTGDSPRARLLGAGRELLSRRDRISDLSLRGLAEQLGTSHRMLIHHFGSRDGFLASVLTEMRRTEQEVLRGADSDGSFRAALDLLEKMYLDPAGSQRVAVLFYVLGLAVQNPEPYREFLASLDDWSTLLASLGVRDGLDPEVARVTAQALVWTARGLVVKGVTTGDPSGALAEFRAVVRVLVPKQLMDAVQE